VSLKVDTLQARDTVLEKIKFPIFWTDLKIESWVLPNITDKSVLRDNSTNLVIWKLPKTDFDHSDLYSMFSKIGAVVCCKVSKTLSKEGSGIKAVSNGYGFVKFSSKEEVDKAL